MNFFQCCYGSDAIPNKIPNTIMSYATVSGEVAIRNHGTSVVPYVDALIAALDKYYAECDLYEILLYVQRIIENEKISIGSNGQFMKGLVCRLADNLQLLPVDRLTDTFAD